MQTLLLAFLAPIAAAQPPQAGLRADDHARLVERLHRLDMGHTDWTLLLDVGEKAKVLGAGAVQVVVAEIAASKEREDPRYMIRLMGVLARIDPPQGTARLAAVIAGEDAKAAAIAARILGRCGAPAESVAAVVADRLPTETRDGVTDALVLAAGDAGASATARLLRDRIESGKASGESLQWFSIALAQVAAKDLQAEAPSWLRPDGKLMAAGLLLVRRAHDTRAEKPVLELLPGVKDEETYAWFAQTLGAIGGEASRTALRGRLAADAAKAQATAKELGGEGAVLLGQSDVSPAQLALVRLGDADALKWVKGTIAAHGSGASGQGENRLTFDTMSPALAQLPELLGKWNVPGAVEILATCAGSEATPVWMRAYAARGLCWRRDPRGLSFAAQLLAGSAASTDPFVGKGVEVAQRTLHEFVADTDRPDYVPSDEQPYAPAPAVGQPWKQWLAGKAGKFRWREPPQDANDMLLWY
jgi:hypothetical protein